MKCHYEVLGIERSVSDEELKKAYRKLALRWHPDKNLDNEEEAKEQFQVVQQAYDVLSDSHERAWYDRHRDAILKGGFGSDYEDKSVNLFPYFTVTCFKGYGDTGNGFYAVYGNLFEKIISEDMEFADDEDSDFEIPRFGTSTSAYDEVVHPFYSYWSSYTTKKTYSWLDTFDIREAENRRVLRLMEKENKRIRDQAKKERNEEVRTLVDFVRKRDKRVQAYKKVLEEKAAYNARKAEENRKRQIKERQEFLSQYTETEWTKMSNLEKELQEIEATVSAAFGQEVSSEDGDTSEDDDLDNLYCVVCNKIFKTEKAFINHEKSKKHKENVAVYKQDNSDDVESSDVTEAKESEEECDLPDSTAGSEDTCCQICNKVFKTEKALLNHLNSSKHKDLSGEEQNSSRQEEENGNSTSLQEEKTHIDENIEIVGADRKKKKSKKQKNVDQAIVGEEKSNRRRQRQSLSEMQNGETHKEEKQSSSKDKKESKKKQSQIQNEGSPVDVQDLKCVVCSKEFPSKNKLFDHLKQSKHAVPVSKPEAEVQSRQKKKNSRKGN